MERLKMVDSATAPELAAEFGLTDTAVRQHLESLESESVRIVDQLEQIGPVNALAFEEYAEESKRLEFLIAQRDDLVAGRQSQKQRSRFVDSSSE